MGFKDKIKRTSRIFMSDSKEDVTENGKGTTGDMSQGTQTADNASGSAMETPAAKTANKAEGTTDTMGEEAMRDATRDVSGSAQDAAAAAAAKPAAKPAADAEADAGMTEAGERGDEDKDKDKENGDMKRKSLFKIRSKGKKVAAEGEAKHGEFFSKIIKKFKRPASGTGGEKKAEKKPAEGSTAGKPADKPADKAADKADETMAAAEGAKGSDVAAEPAAAADTQEMLLDPASDSAADTTVPEPVAAEPTAVEAK